MRITLLSTYPASDPRHGGQHRLANIIAALEEAGHQVSSVGVLGSENYAATPGFLPFPGRGVLGRYFENPFLMEDWAIGEWAAQDERASRALGKLIDPRTDVLFCEQPWLLPFAKRIRAKSRRQMALVYGSQNIESPLKRQIVEAYFSAKKAIECERLVLAAETEAIVSADIIFTVSETDAEWTRSLTNVPVAVAPNGVAAVRASTDDVAAANGITEGRKFALYVASGHPPNVLGFYDMFAAGAGCFPPESRLVVAGSAGSSIKTDDRFNKVANLSRCFIDAGIVSDAQLRGLLQSAHVLFLPMTSGGGTNLKTAEALWAGRATVATSVAMRGFERFDRAAGVHVHDHAPDFLNAIRTCLEAPRVEISREERDDRRSLLWSETLKPMVAAFNQRILVNA